MSGSSAQGKSTSKKSFALIAIIVGGIGVIFGIYTITTVIGTNISENESVDTNMNNTPRTTIDLSKASPILGDPNAPLTIIEFGDYQCVNCGRWFLNVRSEIERNYIMTGKANLYFMDFPFQGKDSLPASEATYCADEQGKYWEYHALLYMNQKGVDNGWANKDALKSFATKLGLDTEKFSNCLESGKYSERAEHNKSIGISNGVRGTPTFFILFEDRVEKIVGAQPFDTFSNTIDKISR